MKFSVLRALPALVFVLYTSCSYAQNKVVVIPLDDNLSVVSVPSEQSLPPGVILLDALTDGKSSGRVIGGEFTDRGWKHISGSDKIIWELSETMEAGIIEFELTGISPSTKGGFLDPGNERAYYFGFFNHPSGNKHPSNPVKHAFIEIRYNWGVNYRNRSAVKFQAGDAGLTGRHGELMGTKRWGDWNPNQYYRHRVVFGDGLATLYIDDVYQTKIEYNDRPLRWRYLFLGDINYTIGAVDNTIFRNVKVTKIK